MKLYTICDFPDDSLTVYTPEMVESLMKQIADNGFQRFSFQYYGNRDYGWCMNCDAPMREPCRKTAEGMPNYPKVIAAAAHRHGLETVAVMRPQEQGVWLVYSPYYTEGLTSGVRHLGGRMLICSKFLEEHPDLRIKRRSYDMDFKADEKHIATIKLYKQNNIPSRIQKDNITIYTSADNCHYRPYTGDFTVTYSTEKAKEIVTLSETKPDYGVCELTKQGDLIQVISISGLDILDKYTAVGVSCKGGCEDAVRFYNAPYHAIAVFDADGNQICASAGGTRWQNTYGVPHLESGFNFDDGFGVNQALVLDPDDREGYFAIAKGKNQYCHGALCEGEPEVRKYWMSLLDDAISDGWDMFSNRIECHSVHVDEPFSYGYNDCLKEEYFRRFGECSEKEIDMKKMSVLRGDIYTDIFKQGAERVRNAGKKVIAALNIEMLHDPIPLDRRYAYPMNVEWQWERWLEEIKPDEINFRMYFQTPDFLMHDPQCLKMLKTAKSYGVPLTVERYSYFDTIAEYEMLNQTGLFDAMTVYETADLFKGTVDGKVIPTERGAYLLPLLKKLATESQ